MTAGDKGAPGAGAEDGANARLNEGAMPLPRLLRQALRALIAIDVFGMMALIFVDVFLRYLFNAPLPGAFEYIQFMLAFLIFCALPLITWTEGHIVVSIFEGLFRRRGLDGVQRLAVMLVSAGGLAIVAYLLWHQAFSLRNSGQITGFVELPLYPIAFVMSGLTVVALAIQVAMIAYDIRHGFRRARRTDPGEF